MPKEFTSQKRIHSQELKRKQIWEAMFLLLQQKSLESISVQDVCDVAMIHRTTFYNHFYDLYDLVGYGAKMILGEIFPVENVLDFDSDAIANHMINFVIAYRNVFGNIIKTPYQQEIKSATQENFEKYILQIVRANLEYYSFDIEPEVMVKFYCGGMTNLFFLWFEDKSIKPEEIKYQVKYSLQGTTQGRYLTGGVPPVRFSM